MDVRIVYEFALLHDIGLDFKWLPRESPMIQQADRLSKLEDVHDFWLDDSVFASLCKAWGHPTVDVLASGGTGHKCARYYSLHAAPGCTGIDAFVQPWAYRPDTGAREFWYAFGRPLFRPGCVIRKIREEKCDAMLIVPSYWNVYWQWVLKGLPIQDSRNLFYHDGLYVPGPLAPPNLQHNVPRVPLTAYPIQY